MPLLGTEHKGCPQAFLRQGAAAEFWKLCPGRTTRFLWMQEAVCSGLVHGIPWPALSVYRRGRERLREAEGFPQGHTAQPDPGHPFLRCLPCGSYCNTVMWGSLASLGFGSSTPAWPSGEKARRLGEKGGLWFGLSPAPVAQFPGAEHRPLPHILYPMTPVTSL